MLLGRYILALVLTCSQSREEAFQYLARRAWARPKLSISTISNFDDDSNSVTDVFEEVEQVDLGVTSPEPRPDNENTLKEFIELREKALKRQDQPKEPLLQPRQSDGPSDRDKVPELLFLFAPRNRYKITRQGVSSSNVVAELANPLSFLLYPADWATSVSRFILHWSQQSHCG